MFRRISGSDFVRLFVAGAIATLAASLIACGPWPRRVQQEPVISNNSSTSSSDAVVAASAARTQLDQERSAMRRDSLAAVASASCSGAVCTALSRGEVAIGMNVAQVITATKSTGDAWSIRESGAATVMVARTLSMPPRDNVGELGMVQLANGRVASYSYRESQGWRVVSSPADATTEGRARAIADALIREGDDYNAAGRRDLALDRYDRALVMRADDAMLQYKVATLLDLQLRPIEALMRYKRFLHQLELEKIDAYGDAYAKLAEAIARARERVIILEKQTR
jgi:tetratricopeptide (TPR) repeat protein